MKKILLTLCMGVFAIIGSATVFAGQYDAQAKALANDKIKAWASSPEVIAAVKAQNAKNASLSEAEIKSLDDKWRAGDNALISSVLGNSLSKYLGNVRDGSQGLYTEIFVMDNKGLNVGQSDKTSDYWQGDEAKWQETFLKGADGIHISDVEKDESTQTYQMQVSVPVVEGGTAIGAVTVGVNAEMLN